MKIQLAIAVGVVVITTCLLLRIDGIRLDQSQHPYDGVATAFTQHRDLDTVDLGQGRVEHTLHSLKGLSTMTLTTDETSGTLTVEMIAPVTAWISFALSPNGKMPNSVAVMAFPQDGTATPEKWLLGKTRTIGDVTRAPDNRQTIVNATAFQNATHTGMKFTKLLQETDEPTVMLSGPNHFLYAAGRDNELGMHALRSSIALDFATLDNGGTGSDSTAPPHKALWMVHGVLMAVSWAILVPLAVGSSILRGLLPLHEGQWFQIHRGLNGFGLTLTIIGFAIAVYCVADEDGKSAKHFQEITHYKIGLVVFIFALLQALSGFFRPHLPTKEAPVVVDNEPEVEAAGECPPEPDTRHTTKKSKARVTFEYQHRILGATTIGLAWYNCDTGLKAYNDRYQGKDLEGALWAVIAVIAATIIVLSVYKRMRSSP
jgi:DOMON domain